MKKLLFPFGTFLLLISITANVVLLFPKLMLNSKIGMTNASEPSAEYIQSLESKVKEYEGRIAALESVNGENAQVNEDITNKVMCLELVKKTPDRGNMSYINIDIVGFYNDAKQHYDELQAGKYTREDEEDNKAEIEFWTELYNESKPLYEEYLKLCK